MQIPSSNPARTVLSVVLLAGVLGAAGRLGAATGDASPSKQLPAPKKDPAIAPLVLDDPLQPLPPERQRTEAEQDRLDALALFSAARAMEWKRKPAEALRCYQRACRYDPDVDTLAKSVVRLAIQLKRPDEAVRAAAKIQAPETLTATQWMGLGLYLMKVGDWQRAVAMYEKVLAAREGAQRTSGYVALKMEMGRLSCVLGEYSKASDCFAEVLKALKKPKEFGLDDEVRKSMLADPGPTYVLMGECFLESERIDEAVAAFREAHRVEPDQTLLDYRLAKVDAQTGKPAEALRKLGSYFDKRLHTEKTAPYRLLSRILEDLGKPDELIPRLQKLYADDEENTSLGYYLARAYFKAERLDEAESLYRKLVEDSPAAVGFFDLAAVYWKTDRLEPLLLLLGEAARAGIDCELFRFDDRPIAEHADRVTALIEIAQKKLEEAPQKLDYHLRLTVALLAHAAERFEVASRFFEAAVEVAPDQASEVLLTRGLGLLSAERYAEAAEIFQRGVDEKALPDNSAVFHFYLAGALEMAGRTDEALEAARRAAELDKDSPSYQSRAAWILYHSDRRQEAARAYAGLIDDLDADFSSAEVRRVMREARLILSNLAVLGDDLPQAEEWLEQLLDEFPDDVAALNDLGYLWADQNVRLQRAHGMIRQAVEGDPKNAAYRDSLGWVLYRLGRFHEAVAELEKAAAAEADPVILDHLGDAHQAEGQTDKALEAWRRAVEGFEKRDETDEAKTVQEKISKHR
ncbi:MAG: tetratricopeptide repeat protein [Planctomycetota bacterium]